ncbi:hypothetical protein GBAR_LOCUS14586 [Geodia barretti]|uniref:Death domain-containing protein n=1 Tax=Geodia barretti TaxID=519541 RepID=A0AA35S832_GEOBA|nr:hypothetical protein GBAR_LOCUS14586 [Geodia barretti]
MKVVKDVEKWWGAGSLSNWLYIPKAHQNDIRVQFSDVKEQKNEALSYWIYKDPLASWRRLIVALERAGEFEKADSIRSNAEPLTDVSLTTRSVMQALSCVTQFWGGGVVDYLGLTWSVMDRLRYEGEYPCEQARKEAAIEYCLKTQPGMSWGKIAGVLWQLKEKKALENVRKYLPSPHDLRVTHLTLSAEVESRLPESLWDQFCWRMNVPDCTQNIL